MASIDCIRRAIIHKVAIVQLSEACLKSFVRFVVVAVVSVLTGHIGIATAAVFEMKKVRASCRRSATRFEQVLTIDGREVLKDAILNIEDIHLISGTPAIVGSSSAGGNACDSAPFVVSFPRDANPRVDGPIESCLPMKMEVLTDQLTFTTAALPNFPGETWIWTPDKRVCEIRRTGLRRRYIKGLARASREDRFSPWRAFVTR